MSAAPQSPKSIHLKTQYLKKTLGIDSILVPEKTKEELQQLAVVAAPQDFVAGGDASSTVLTLLPTVQYQTFNEGPFLFLSWSYEKMAVEEFQLLEKIIVALKIPFHRTSIAAVGCESSQLTLENLKKITQGFPFVFLMGSIWANGLHLQFGEKRVLDLQTFFLTYDLQSLIKDVELKKQAWSHFKVILAELQSLSKQTASAPSPQARL